MDLQMPPNRMGFEATEYIRTTMNSKIHCALTADIYHVDLANVNQWEE
jgi:CheY-like chemotaxis protein